MDAIESDDNKAVRFAAGLFLLSMTASMIYTGAYRAVLDLPLAQIPGRAGAVAAGSFLELVNCLAVVGIGVMLYGVLKKCSGTLARLYVFFRVIESAVLLAGVACAFALIPLGRELLDSPAADPAVYGSIKAVILSCKETALQLGILVCSVGGIMFAWLLLRFRLVPRAIGALGLAGYVLVVASAILHLSGVIDTVRGSGSMLYIPGGLFEAIVLPAWFLARGVNMEHVK